MSTERMPPSAHVTPFDPVDIPGKPWGTECLVAHTPYYTGKVLCRYAGATRGGLQYHRVKDETFYLFSGECWVYTVDQSATPQRHKMTAGMSFHVPPGAIHSVEAITDCVFFEVSTPVFDDRVRVEEAYDLTPFGASVAAPGGNGPDTDVRLAHRLVHSPGDQPGACP